MPRSAHPRRTRLNQRLLAAPARAVLTLAWLRERGISGKLANYYARSGWLHAVGEGAFTVLPGVPDWRGAVFGLQQNAPALHPGGLTALELAGLAQFVLPEEGHPIHLFAPRGGALPVWFRRLPWAGRVWLFRTGFLPDSPGLEDHETGSFTVRISGPERAILEFLQQLPPDSAAYTYADQLFGSLGGLRPAVLQPLLEACTSVKVKRLFLHFAARHAHAWFPALDPARITLGRGKRRLFHGGRLDPAYLITVPSAPDTPERAA